MVTKNFLKAGTSYFDIGLVASFKFYPDDKGYIIMLIYFVSTNKPVKIKIKNRNELSEFFYLLDKYIDPELKDSLVNLINEIDKMKSNQKDI